MVVEGEGGKGGGGEGGGGNFKNIYFNHFLHDSSNKLFIVHTVNNQGLVGGFSLSGYEF